MTEKDRSPHAGRGSVGRSASADPSEGLADQIGQLTASTIEMWSAWGRTWQSVLNERAGPALDFSLQRMLDPSSWFAPDAEGLNEDLEQVFGVPRFADLLNFDVTALKSWAPAVELAQVGSDYARAASEVWFEICRRFQTRLSDMERQHQSSENAGDVLDTWNAVVDQSLLEFARSEDFLDIQRRFLRAVMRFRIEQRNVFESGSQLYDLPTRSEMDEVHRKLHRIERELRAFRRAQVPDVPKAEERPKRPARRSPTKKTRE